MDWMPNFASDGNPLMLRMDVTIMMAMATIVSEPLAVDIIFLRPEAVVGDSVGFFDDIYREMEYVILYMYNTHAPISAVYDVILTH